MLFTNYNFFALASVICYFQYLIEFGTFKSVMSCSKFDNKKASEPDIIKFAYKDFVVKNDSWHATCNVKTSETKRCAEVIHEKKGTTSGFTR
jgi:hypothetical protein